MLTLALAGAVSGSLIITSAPQTQSYLISLDDAPVGFATLAVERISQKEVKYAWHAELTVSGEPCLRSTESSAGKAKLSDPVLPEELFVVLAPDLGNGCRKIRGGATPAETGQGCWTEASQEHAEGTLFGTPVRVNFGPDTMPAAVRYPKLGVIYRSAADIPDELRECSPTVADKGVVAPGGAGLVAGSVEKATYRGADESVTVQRLKLALPAAASSALEAMHGQDIKSCRAAAEGLADKLKAKHLQPRLVSGLLLDHGRYFPHAWVEVKIGKDWVPLDATTDSGPADASHLKIGPLGDFHTGIELLKALHSPPTVTVEQ